MARELGIISQKVLLLLGAGLALGLSASPTRYFKILKAVGKEWKDIEKRALHRAIKNLYRSKLIEIKEDESGSVVLKLNKEGKEKILKYKLDIIRVPKMKNWDRKWRVVLFDIPEPKKKIRDVLRFHLKNWAFLSFKKAFLYILLNV